MTEENFKQQDDIIRIIGAVHSELPHDFVDSENIVNKKYYEDICNNFKIELYLNENFKLKHIKLGKDPIFSYDSLICVYSHV